LDSVFELHPGGDESDEFGAVHFSPPILGSVGEFPGDPAPTGTDRTERAELANSRTNSGNSEQMFDYPSVYAQESEANV
jgi:hypothetical protein